MKQKEAKALALKYASLYLDLLDWYELEDFVSKKKLEEDDIDQIFDEVQELRKKLSAESAKLLGKAKPKRLAGFT